MKSEDLFKKTKITEKIREEKSKIEKVKESEKIKPRNK
jgi:hypothetical protein